MLEFIITEDLGLKWIALRGRVDGMSSPDVQKQIEEQIRSGERILIVDLEGVNYISSAGLRVFLTAQKNLKKANGEILLLRVPDAVLSILQTSGMLGFFKVFNDPAGLATHAGKGTAHPAVEHIEAEGVSLRCLDRTGKPGTLKVFGSQAPLALAAYTEKDVVSVRADEVRFGTGLASVGEHYEEYGRVFGESVIVDRNFYFYPAVRHAAVDFMLAAEQESGLEYRFLHGFGFNGEYSSIITFESTEGFVDLTRLVNFACRRVEANLLGLVLLAESKGLWGMHMKRVPTVENSPGKGSEIFDASNFTAWMNFPVEPADAGSVVMGAGIAVKNRELERPEVAGLLPSGSDFHVHAGIFSKEPLSKDPIQFETELNRIATELAVFKVQHLLGQSCFDRGTIGIIELKG